VVVLATKGGPYDKIISNIQEVKARKGVVIAVVTEGDTIVTELADYVIEIPPTLSGT
jgi:glucosamine--fructose-6-phosphate aminotransferase (isomerizing)